MEPVRPEAHQGQASVTLGESCSDKGRGLTFGGSGCSSQLLLAKPAFGWGGFQLQAALTRTAVNAGLAALTLWRPVL